MRRRLGAVASCVVLGATACGSETATPLEDPIPPPVRQAGPRVELELVASGLTAPNWGIPAPGDDDHLFVTDQVGTAWVIDLRTGDKDVFLDVTARLVPLGTGGRDSYDERGLLGLAFHPDYGENGLFYTFTSEPVDAPADFSTMPAGVAPDHQNVLSEWTVPDPADDGAGVDPGTRREVVRIDQPQYSHNGGALAFGPDGFLYVSLGDGGNPDDQGVGHSPQGNGQDPSNVLGTILRIDPTGSNSANGRYGVPADNPFVDEEGFVPEIWAYGFRNPFRLSFDSRTGALMVADVGQHNVEEVDIVTRGGNYGWPVKEGSFLFEQNGDEPGFVTERSRGEPDDLIDPIAEYDHDEGLAAVGGFVYRGTAIPQLRGRYVFGDWAGRLFFLTRRGRVRQLPLAGRNVLGVRVDGFGQDADGELYLLGNTSGTPFGDTGVVLRIQPTD